MNTDAQTLLGRYKLVKVLGRGAMGVVYEATDTRLSRTVAIKTVQRGFLADDATAADYAARFEREAQAAARLNHPHIVAVFDFGEQDDASFIVMEFVRGRELGQAFADGERFSVEETVRIMGELLDALAYAHEHGVVHRDVKPANVMIDSAGRVKLTDFGVARLSDGNQDRTVPGTMVGTPSYMAPEQILGLAVGSRADIFGAGVVLYQFLTGTRPFVGSGPFGIQRTIVHDEPMPPSQLDPTLPAGFDAIVSRALAKRPEDRFETAAVFAAELRRVSKAAQPAAAGAVPDLDLDLDLDLDPDRTVVRAGGHALPPAATGTVPPPAQTALPERVAVPAPTSTHDTPAATPSTAPAAVPAAAAAPPRERVPAPLARRLWFGAVATTVAAAAGLWLVLQRPPPAAMPAARSALQAASAASAVEATSTGTSPPAAAPSSNAVASGLAPGAAAAPGAATSVERPSLAQQRAPASDTRPAAAGTRPQQVPPRPVSAPPASGDPGPRTVPADRACIDLLLRMQLGDQLTPAQTTYFHTRCAR